MTNSEGWLNADDGVRLFYRAIGSSAPAVIVPNGLYLADDFAALGHHTIVFFDVRNRGRSDAISDPSQLGRGIHADVDDIEAVRRHFGFGTIDLIGHSYVGITVVLYAMKYPHAVRRVVQLGPMDAGLEQQYPAHLSNADETLRSVFARLGALQAERATLQPEEFCRRVWAVLREIYVVDPANAGRIRWDRCDLPNERAFMRYWMESLVPSIRALALDADALRGVRSPVLIVHGTKDRSAPYGGGRRWATMLPDARLVSVDEAAHAPWIEDPQAVFGAISTFLAGSWPSSAHRVTAVDTGPRAPA